MTTNTINTTEYVQELSDAELEQINGGWFFLPALFKFAVKAVKVAIKISKAYGYSNSATAKSAVVQHVTKAAVGIRMNEGMAAM
ncbi:MAG: hypothetical protein ACO23C_06340 [Prochlorococcaceae cyanobacterium]